MKLRITKRVSHLEARIIEDSKLGHFETGQVMTADEWDAQALKAQAQLLLDHALIQKTWDDKHDNKPHSP
jgi:hypothetical protein